MFWGFFLSLTWYGRGASRGFFWHQSMFFYLTTFPSFLPRFTFPFIKLRQRGFLHLGFGLLSYTLVLNSLLHYLLCRRRRRFLDVRCCIFLQLWITLYLINASKKLPYVTLKLHVHCVCPIWSILIVTYVSSINKTIKN